MLNCLCLGAPRLSGDANFRAACVLSWTFLKMTPIGVLISIALLLPGNCQETAMPPKAPRLLGDRVQKAKPGELVELWIYSAYPKDHWIARKAGDLMHA